MTDDNKDIDFIAGRYRIGRFSIDEGWKRLNIAPSFLRWKRVRVAAAIASVIVLSATAAMIYRQYDLTSDKQVQQPEQLAVSPKEVVKIIDFDNAALPTVITKIKEVYGVEIVNIPENADEYHLSLHYEGNAVDLVTTINDILDTQMSVKE